ncbi:MAG TPA: tetratricopeptide repeat protein [Bryobacteraceae bacterium]|nr:tetratricopeptide repeat protein [Bryobacteraceae bacterium]
MSRWPRIAVLACALTAAAGAQQKQEAPLPPDEDAPAKSAQKPDSQKPDDNLPPDEDAAANPNEKIAFNPVKSKKDVSVGDYYFHKGDFNAASNRFREATQYDESNSQAWLRLGEADEKRGLAKSARAAYEKYLQLAPDSKAAADVKKRLEKLR